MEHTDNAYNGLYHYFSILEQTGYYKDQDVKGLLIYCFIVDQIFDGPLQPYLDDKGLSVLNKVIRCITKNNCLIDMPSDNQHISEPRKYYVDNIFRISEYEALRNTEDDRIRSTEIYTETND